MIGRTKMKYVVGLIIAFKVDWPYPRFEALMIKALLDREKNVTPDSILESCAHKLLAFNRAQVDKRLERVQSPSMICSTYL
ncbi:MAG: hypothetical protein QOH51_2248 [Acidobacteriota bacterium]|nr:hypothetical protein [Acidobacteriota bacterium]